MTIGKKLNAFTIERTEVVYGSSVVTMNYLRRFKVFLKRLLFGSTAEYKRLIDLAQRAAVLNMQESIEKADYIVNVKIQYSRVGKNEVEVCAYGTAVHLFPDTLGLYFLPEIPNIQDKLTQRFDVIKNFFVNLLIPVLFVFAVYSFQVKVERDIINEFSLADEQTVWNYISSKSSISERNLPDNLVDVEQRLQEIIGRIQNDKDSQFSFDITAILIDSEDKEIKIMPNGNLLIYKGFLRDIRSEDSLVFLLAHAIQHYKNQDNIKNLGSSLVTPYLFIHGFGADSFFAKWIVRIYPFGDAPYSDEQQKVATQTAIDITNKMYGNITGINQLRAFANQNNFIKEHISFQLVDNYIATNGLKEGNTTTIEFLLDKPEIIAPSHTNLIPKEDENEKFQEVIAEFRLSSNSMITKYRTAMNFVPALLDPSSLSSKDAIKYKLDLVDYGVKTVNFYQDQLNTSITDYDDKMLTIYANIEDQNKIRILNSLWVAEADQFIKTLEFYFTRDKEILKNQQGALNFLYNRSGQYGLLGGKLRFKLQNDQDSYNSIIDRINAQYSKQPPIIKKVKK